MSRMLARLLLGCLIGLLVPLGQGMWASRATEGWDFSNDAWAYLRAKTPAERNVYRPTWLPARFRQPAFASTIGLQFGATYLTDSGERLFFGTSANSCGGNDTPEPITVRGYPGFFVAEPECGNSVRVYWLEGEQFYQFVGHPGQGNTPPGRDEMLRIAASSEPVGVDGRPKVSAGPPARECFAETGRCIAGRFLDRWRATGGVTINGFPLGDEFTQTLEDGRAYTVQYFERVRLEHHPENAPPYDVLLGQFGRRLHGRVDPPVAPDPDAPEFFPETGHNLSGLFYDTWREHGLAQFGYPLTEEIVEMLEDGRAHRVQYFERARLEYHPDNAWPYKVLLGQFGRRILAETTPRP